MESGQNALCVNCFSHAISAIAGRPLDKFASTDSHVTDCVERTFMARLESTLIIKNLEKKERRWNWKTIDPMRLVGRIKTREKENHSSVTPDCDQRGPPTKIQLLVTHPPTSFLLPINSKRQSRSSSSITTEEWKMWKLDKLDIFAVRAKGGAAGGATARQTRQR